MSEGISANKMLKSNSIEKPDTTIAVNAQYGLTLLTRSSMAGTDNRAETASTINI